MKLEQVLREPEGKTLEFKRDLSSHRPIGAFDEEPMPALDYEAIDFAVL